MCMAATQLHFKVGSVGHPRERNIVLYINYQQNSTYVSIQMLFEFQFETFDFLNLPNPSGRTRPWDLLSL
jgi:hypothetical protein